MIKRPALRFVSTLPRSGSTLLCNILAQNPRFHATHTSGLLDVVFGLRNSWDNHVEHKAHPIDDVKKNVLRAVLNTYHGHIEKDVVFDKSRGWIAFLEMVEDLTQEKAKVLVCVRDIPDILSSLEKLYRKTSAVKQPPGEAKNFFQFQTIEGRCEYWLQPDQLVGIMMNRIDDALNRGFRDRLHFIQYNELTKYPDAVMKKAYEFLDEPSYQHNFDYVEQVTQEDDSIHGFLDLHTIQNKVEYRPSDARKVLGAKLYEKYVKYNFDLSAFE